MSHGTGMVAFLPCRSGSQRVPLKNTRPFAGRADGLLGIKLDQLERVRGLDAVVLDSNDPVVLDFGRRRQSSWSSAAELRVVERPDELGQSTTTTDSLIGYALERVACEVLLWTHVTSPLFGAAEYEAALAAYEARDPDHHDSLMGVTPVQGFIWTADGPINYARAPLRWPRTQDLAPVYEINSAVFMVSRALGRELGDRIGRRPLLFPVPRALGQEIDDPHDFAIAEQLYLARPGAAAE